MLLIFSTKHQDLVETLAASWLPAGQAKNIWLNFQPAEEHVWFAFSLRCERGCTPIGFRRKSTGILGLCAPTIQGLEWLVLLYIVDIWERAKLQILQTNLFLIFYLPLDETCSSNPPPTASPHEQFRFHVLFIPGPF